MICLADQVGLWDLRGWLSEASLAALGPLGHSLSGKQPPLEDTEPWAPLGCRGRSRPSPAVQPSWLRVRTLREAAFTSQTSLSAGFCVTSVNAMRSQKTAQGKPAQIPDPQNS